ncbi:OmpP1/FadL family transporter [Coralloluteibacterium stylophorae]|uniref:Outer membrane protein transport protein n=1 Tax=Coralloluteibacterium stylophorae TaxID=1776034 RepID=A0A8J8B0G7_9GAMM|nr:outer membrane protein transport protein [Coralloluteibacterium stylophorae]MBS7458068.1 outer membrane protein transport protein [Coralloluteibacterium stylophorae]
MHTRNLSLRSSVLALAVVAACGTAPAFAGGFQIKENSAVALGRAFAGSASAPGDAAIISNNPAGMRLLGDGYVVQADVTALNLQAEYQNDFNRDALGRPLSGGDGGDGGDLNWIPAAYFAMPLGEQAHLGAYLDAPFGLKTEYDSDWVGRYSAVKSELKTIDAGLSFSYDVNPYVSFGGSVFYQYADAELTNAVDFGAIIANTGLLPPGTFLPQSADGYAKVEGDDHDWGFKLGALFTVVEGTNIGLTYRSKVEHNLEGDATFDVPANVAPLLGALPGNLFSNTGGSAAIDTPAVATLSVTSRLNDQWTIMGDVSRTAWSSFESLVVDFENPAQPNSTETFEWRDTWFGSIGTEYQVNEQLILRGGIAYDQTPTNLEHRSPRVPDADRRWLSLGATWMASASTAFNVGYTHLFTSEPEIATTSSTGAFINGHYDTGVDILAASVTYRF